MSAFWGFLLLSILQAAANSDARIMGMTNSGPHESHSKEVFEAAPKLLSAQEVVLAKIHNEKKEHEFTWTGQHRKLQDETSATEHSDSAVGSTMKHSMEEKANENEEADRKPMQKNVKFSDMATRLMVLLGVIIFIVIRLRGHRNAPLTRSETASASASGPLLPSEQNHP
eukprot:TRINITY_DN103421_c0_g1_i1.p1 TRINITY_DN103421_c0_g1~~TRINITY_DN103421_c0_g1_i1.p1  ORF type:complete len:170 (+),score=32.32 TRINITY_DN103421_c0_g1_i1:64-573(+)